MSEALAYRKIPAKFERETFDEFLTWAYQEKVSDVHIQSDQPLWCDRYGKQHRVNVRQLGLQELIDIIVIIYGENGPARLKEGFDFDVSYVVKVTREESIRFRVNATAILNNGRDGIQITMRILQETPPSLEDQMLEPEILEHMFPERGFVVVTGPTGSGKTTLLAGVIRHILESATMSEKLLEYGAPIEYTFDRLEWNNSLIAQSEVPRNIKSFPAAVRNALRRKPTRIIISESRDAETMSAAAEAALTGHGVYSTVHSDSVRNTIRRMVMTFTPAERAEQSLNLMESMRLVVSQTLVPKIGGGRVALREYLVFDEEIRNAFLTHPPESWPAISIRIMADHGRSMLQAAMVAHHQGLIDESVLNTFMRKQEVAHVVA